MAFLGGGAGVDHVPRIAVEHVPRIVGVGVGLGEGDAGCRCAADFRVVERVEDQLQLRRHLRGDAPGQAMRALVQTPESQEPSLLRVAVGRLGAVRVEHHCERRRELPQIVRRRRRARTLLARVDGIRTIAGIRVHIIDESVGVPGENLIRPEALLSPDAGAGVLDRVRRGQEPRNPDRPVQQGIAQGGPPGGEPLPGDEVHVSVHQIGGFHDLRRRRAVGQQSPLQQFVHAPASVPMPELHIGRRHGLHDDRVDQPGHLPEPAQHLGSLRIRETRQGVIGQHSAQVGRDLRERCGDAVHTSIMPRATDIPTLKTGRSEKLFPPFLRSLNDRGGCFVSLRSRDDPGSEAGVRNPQHSIAAVRQTRERLVPQGLGQHRLRRILEGDRPQEPADRGCSHRGVQ